MRAQPDRLRYVGEEVQDPGAQLLRDAQEGQLIEEDVQDDCVKS